MLIMLIVSFVVAALSCNKVFRDAHLHPGDEAPEFIATLTDGRHVTMADFAGKPTVIVIFDVFSHKNKELLCEMQRIRNHWRDNVNVLAICERGNPETGVILWNEWKLDIPVSIDKESEILRRFNKGDQGTVPQIFCISADGKIDRYYGDENITDYLQIEKDYIIPQIIESTTCENI